MTDEKTQEEPIEKLLERARALVERVEARVLHVYSGNWCVEELTADVARVEAVYGEILTSCGYAGELLGAMSAGIKKNEDKG